MADVKATMTAGRRKLPVIPARQIVREISDWQKEVADIVISKLRVYPRELDGQRYIRTYRLKGAWRRSSESSFQAGQGMTITITNFVTDRKGKRYASLVQGVDQKPIHMDRWLRIDEAMQSENANYRAGIKRIFKSHGIT